MCNFVIDKFSSIERLEIIFKKKIKMFNEADKMKSNETKSKNAKNKANYQKKLFGSQESQKKTKATGDRFTGVHIYVFCDCFYIFYRSRLTIFYYNIIYFFVLLFFVLLFFVGV